MMLAAVCECAKCSCNEPGVTWPGVVLALVLITGGCAFAWILSKA